MHLYQYAITIASSRGKKLNSGMTVRTRPTSVIIICMLVTSMVAMSNASVIDVTSSRQQQCFDQGGTLGDCFGLSRSSP
jgi:hypothetical protein